MPTPTVAILGAGIGGLTLGRYLRQMGIPAIIYQRSSSMPKHSYGITLQASAYRPLLKVLDMDEHAFRRSIAVDKFRQTGVGKVFAGQHPDNTSTFRTNRHKLETMLAEGQTIKLDHTLSSATLLEDVEGVDLSFADGTNLRPSLVVDMTGVHSKLRNSILPQTQLEVLPYAVYSGKRYINFQHFEEIYAPAFGDGNCITWNPRQASDPRLEITVNDHLPDGKVSISYIYSRPSRAGSSQDPLHNPARSNSDATNIPEEFYSELQTFVEDQDLQQPFKDVFNAERIRSDRLLHWLMRTALVPEADLQKCLTRGVMILGDAAHAVPILGGWGANVAISDAVELADVISRSGAEKEPLAAFYRGRYSKWAAEVENARSAIAKMHAPAKASL